MATCWSCNKVRGKRACPAHGGELICSKCCGTKRQISIQCPSDCTYLKGADAGWQSATRQKEEARFIACFFQLNEAQLVFSLFVHHLVFSAGARFASLSDDELEDVLRTARKTLETRTKGIVYSHHAQWPGLERLADWLAKLLSERAQIQSAPEASDADVVQVLQTIERAVEAHASQGAKRGGYLELARQVFASSLEGAPPLELPSELDEPPSGLIVTP